MREMDRVVVEDTKMDCDMCGGNWEDLVLFPFVRRGKVIKLIFLIE